MYLETEELTKVLEEKDDFKEVKEYKLEFLPSYKFNQKTGEYDLYKGKRIPSHTDRVLYIGKETNINVLKYFKEDKMNISDHKPVIFQCELNTIDVGGFLVFMSFMR